MTGCWHAQSGIDDQCGGQGHRGGADSGRLWCGLKALFFAPDKDARKRCSQGKSEGKLVGGV